MIAFMVLLLRVLLLRVRLRLVLGLWPRFRPWFRPHWRWLTVHFRSRPVHFLAQLLASLRPVELLMWPVLYMLRRWLRLLHCRLLIAAERVLVQVFRCAYTLRAVLSGRPMVRGILLQFMHSPIILSWLATTRVLRCAVKLGLVLHDMHGPWTRQLVGTGCRRRAAGSKIPAEIWLRHIAEVRWSVITSWGCGKRRAIWSRM